jgi:hypothetical protein
MEAVCPVKGKKRNSMARFIDTEEIDAHRTPNGGWNRMQLAQWGVPWPPPHGWREAIIANGIPYRASAKKECRSSVLCRNCCTPMTVNLREYVCERCGLTWRRPDAE